MNFYWTHRVLPAALLLCATFFLFIIRRYPEVLRSLETVQENMSKRRGNYALIPLELVIGMVKKDFRFTPLIVSKVIAAVSVLTAIALFFSNWP